MQVEKLKGDDQLLIVPNRELMARYGLNMADIRRVTETTIVGHQASEVIKGRRRFALRVKFPEGDHIDPAQVGNLLIETTQGRVLISQVAKIQIEEGLELVNREMGQRRIIIQLNVQHRDVGYFVKEARKKIAEKVSLPQGFTLEWGGQFENHKRAMNRLTIVVPVSILIIFLLLMATFSSVKNALLVMANVPFALIGGIIAL